MFYAHSISTVISGRKAEGGGRGETLGACVCGGARVCLGNDEKDVE